MSGIHEFDWKAQLNCNQVCKPDCDKETYNLEMVEVEDDIMSQFKLTKNEPNLGYVAVLTNHLTQLTYHHLPKMELIDFLCSIGGLFSLWLGLSVISIYDYTVTVGSAFKSKFKICSK